MNFIVKNQCFSNIRAIWCASTRIFTTAIQIGFQIYIQSYEKIVQHLRTCYGVLRWSVSTNYLCMRL